MLEYHGWATIKEAFIESEEDEEKLDYAISRVRVFVGEIDISHRDVRLSVFNGQWMLTASGFCNHRRPDFEQIIDLYKLIGDCAPGSYGILSFQDDEDVRPEKQNYFQHYTLKKGILTLSIDHLLSPVIPNLEEI